MNIVISLYLIIFSGYVIYYLISIGKYLVEKNNWDKLEKIEVRVLKSNLSDYSGFSNYFRNEHLYKRKYKANIEFEYNYKGIKFISTTPSIKAVQIFPLYDFESDLVQRYQEGEVYEARVKRNDPSKAFLTIAPIDKTGLILVLGLLLCIPLIYEILINVMTWWDPLTGPGDWWYRP